jgi:galactonate dehydratase
MKITEIASYPVWVGDRPQLLVKVDTDEGIFGWGEAGLAGRELAVSGALRHFREFLLGRDPMRRGDLWQEAYRGQYNEGGRVLAAAIGAVDIALHDLVAKKLGVPVYELLGGRHRDHVDLFATTSAETGPELLQAARLLRAERWNVIRLGFLGCENDEHPTRFDPRSSLAPTAEWVARIRDELGHDVTIGIDYHHRLTVPEAAAFCQMLPPHTLDFIEEPIRHETPEAYVALRQMTPIPFAIGEELTSKWGFAPYLERQITQFARVDVCTVGGLTEALKIAALAETHYIDLMPHCPLGPVGTAASAHLCLAVPNVSWLEIRASPTEPAALFFDPEIYPRQLLQAGPVMHAPTGPGLGVDVNEDAVREAAFRFFEPPHLRRPDGSVTNW